MCVCVKTRKGHPLSSSTILPIPFDTGSLPKTKAHTFSRLSEMLTSLNDPLALIPAELGYRHTWDAYLVLWVLGSDLHFS